MLLELARGRWLLATGPGTPAAVSVSWETDPVPLNRNNRATMTLLIRDLTTGGGAGDIVLEARPIVANDITSGFVDMGLIASGESASPEPHFGVLGVNAAYVAFKFTLVVKNVTGAVRGLFDAQVLLDRQ